MELSPEQERFIIQTAVFGNNVLVDACIGSGKTTAIQYLCNSLPQKKKILYLTYNRLLKIDAQSKIKKKNVTVTNYHSFAYKQLSELGVHCGTPELIHTFITIKPKIKKYDVLIIDEYQDIEQEFATMLEMIKSVNPQMQIVAVGDMAQKIYDKTTLNVLEFIDKFLGEYKKLTFTNCFRLSNELAEKLGRVWGKTIKGVNDTCKVEQMTLDEVVEFLSNQQPKDILCLGPRVGKCAQALNYLEEQYPYIFNKSTVYASISDEDRQSKIISKDTAIFTTYDSSKGLERKICVVFDFTEDYWGKRINSSFQSFEILRNIFCVAASRGKEHIIFVVSNDKPLLSEETLSTITESNEIIERFSISNMFDFKYREDIQESFDLLSIKPIETIDSSIIRIDNSDGYIDLSPCIGIYQEASFFNGYSIESSIEMFLSISSKKYYRYPYNEEIKQASLERKILYYTYLETNQERYYTQVTSPFVKNDQKQQIHNRINTVLSADEKVQKECLLRFFNKNNPEKVISIIGLADVVKDNTVYELKFVSELKYEHFLQCACYVVALGLEKGVLWNTMNNSMFEVTVPDKSKFLSAVVKTITKGHITEGKYDTSNDNTENQKTKLSFSSVIKRIKKFFDTRNRNNNQTYSSQFDECYVIDANSNSEGTDDKKTLEIIEEINKQALIGKEKEKVDDRALSKCRTEFTQNNELNEEVFLVQEEKSINQTDNALCRDLFAIIDTETNYEDEVMSIGLVIADADSFDVVTTNYFIISPEYKKGGMFATSLGLVKKNYRIVCERGSAIKTICKKFEHFNINSIFAYNASFDYRHLPELQYYEWFDIVQLAAYKQYNHKIPESTPCWSTGRLKKWGLESVMRILLEKPNYIEKHNALFDAFDELKIMRILEYKPCDYSPLKTNLKQDLKKS